MKKLFPGTLIVNILHKHSQDLIFLCDEFTKRYLRLFVINKSEVWVETIFGKGRLKIKKKMNEG